MLNFNRCKIAIVNVLQSAANKLNPIECANSFVSKDGSLRLPKQIMKALNIPNGGGVMFIKNRNNEMLIISDDEYCNRLSE